MKKNVFHVLAGAVLLGLLPLQSCTKDLSGDVDGLRDEVKNLKSQLGTLDEGLKGVNQQIKDGKIITGVHQTPDGLKIDFDSKDSYLITNGKKGDDGKDGKDGRLYYIGENGNWFYDETDKDGNVVKHDTGKESRGKVGPQGPKGNDGTDGTSTIVTVAPQGTFYAPSQDGTWSKFTFQKDGTIKEEKTTERWAPENNSENPDPEIQPTAAFVNGKVILKNYRNAEGELMADQTVGFVQLTNLICIPDIVSDEGGALPYVGFDLLKTKCASIRPDRTLKFSVAPRNASFEDLANTESLSFIFNSPMVRAAEVAPAKAEFVSFDNKKGVLTVKVDFDFVEAATKPGHINQVMLYVPLKSGGNAQSDWVKVDVDKTIDYKDLHIARVTKDHDATVHTWNLVLPKKVELAKDTLYMPANTIPSANFAVGSEYYYEHLFNGNQRVTDHRVVEIVYNAKVDILDQVELLLADGQSLSEFKKLMATYGLYFGFDQVDENGDKITFESGSNKTPQEEFLVMEDGLAKGSLVSSRVYNLPNQSKAAIGRTPVVRVFVKSTKAPACDVTIGFLKLKFVDKYSETREEAYDSEAYTYECGDGGAFGRVETQEMNKNYYDYIGMDKDKFHQEYELVDLDAAAAKKVLGKRWDTDFKNWVYVGEIKPDVDPSANQTHNPVWYVNDAERKANLGKKIFRVAQYISKESGHIAFTIIFRGEIGEPVFDLAPLRNMSYWFEKSSGNRRDYRFESVRFNVRIPVLKENDPAKCLFETNINTAFKNVAQLLELKAGYSYNYTFSDDQSEMNKALKGVEEFKTWSVKPSADGKTLMLITPDTATGTPILQIDDRGASSNSNEIKGNVVMVLQDVNGLKLLNHSEDFLMATFKITITNSCGLDVKVKGLFGKDTNEFDIHFLRPINTTDVTDERFIDGVDFGMPGSIVDIRPLVGLEDWRNIARFSKEYSFDPNHSNYYDYYGVVTIIPTIDKITVEGMVDSAGKPITKLPSTVDVQHVTSANLATFGFTGELLKVFEKRLADPKGKYGVLYYKNNGANLMKSAKLNVPVVINYKWGVIKNVDIQVPVQHTDNSNNDPSKVNN